MKNQKLVQIGGVRERYVPGAGATPVLRTSRAGSAALVAPAPRHTRYPENIWRRYQTHLRRIQTGSVQHLRLILIASAIHNHETTTSSTGDIT